MCKSAIFFSFFIGVGASVFAMAAVADEKKAESFETTGKFQEFKHPVVRELKPLLVEEKTHGADESAKPEAKEEALTADGK